MKTYAQQAELYRILLQAEVLSVGDVIQWADSLIASEDTPDDELVDLSLSGVCKQQEIEVQLLNMATGCNKFAAMWIAIPKMITALESGQGCSSTIVRAIKNWAKPSAWFPSYLWFIEELGEGIPPGLLLSGLRTAIQRLHDKSCPDKVDRSKQTSHEPIFEAHCLINRLKDSQTTVEFPDAILEAHCLWLEERDGGSCADLREADLRGANLHRANLRKALLLGANLSGADLSKANLCEAILVRANLRGANLREADLRGADLREVDLCDADMHKACLGGAHVRKEDLFKAKNLL